MLSAEGLEEEGGYKSFTHQRFQETEGSAKRRRTRARDRSESFLVPSNYVMETRPKGRDVRQFGHSQSDSFDACEPAVRPVSSLIFVLCNLSFVRPWLKPCAEAQLPFMFESSRTLTRIKFTDDSEKTKSCW
jgi:hypothetical protein